ncbi:MAG: arginine N-succinyltransferase [Bdellovibrio sp.]|nr:arginine N-succinyltransferase [Bdellovibrio sp.]
MYLIRNVDPSDLNDLYELSGLVTFINLPRDIDLIKKKIASSVRTFKRADKDKSKNNYIFVLEDTENKKVIGVSMIHGQHGTDEEPHYYLTVGQEEKFSETINTGFIHGTLKLDYECNGYTEIGGLVLHPDYRSNVAKLGKQISFVRFLYIGMHPNQFTSLIHSELMPPFDKDGNSPLWEAIGRKFMNVDYHEADVLSRQNKEFILSLFPSEIIYTSLLPIEARDAIGKVGDDTKPVKKMLESIGFKYTKEVDPFDGGPHYRAPKNEIKPIREMFAFKILAEAICTANEAHTFLITLPSDPGKFKAMKVEGKLEENVRKNLILTSEYGHIIDEFGEFIGNGIHL